MGSVITGILFTTTQYAVAHELGGFALWELFRSADPGGVGTVVYLVLEGAMRGHEERFRRAIDEHVERNQDEGLQLGSACGLTLEYVSVAESRSAYSPRY